MKLILITLVSLLSSPVMAQQEIKIEDAVDHAGDSVKICSTVYGGRFLEAVKGSPTFLNLGSSYQSVPVTIIIWGNVRNEFKTAPEELYDKQEVCVTGKIKLRKGKPEIVLLSKNQIYINR